MPDAVHDAIYQLSWEWSHIAYESENYRSAGQFLVESHGRRQKEEMSINCWEWGWEKPHQGTDHSGTRRRNTKGRKEKRMTIQKINVAIVSLICLIYWILVSEENFLRPILVFLMNLFNNLMTDFSTTVKLSSAPNPQAQALPTPTGQTLFFSRPLPMGSNSKLSPFPLNTPPFLATQCSQCTLPLVLKKEI